MKRTTKAVLTALLMLIVTSLTACGGKQEGKSDVIKMASWSKPITEQANLYAAQEKGWFAEKNIEFQFIPGSGSSDAIKNILSGQADIAFADPLSIYAALAQGEKLRIVYNIYPQNVFNLVSLAGSEIMEPKDLKGKTIGVYSFASGTYHHLLVLLQEAGLSEQDVTIVETGLLNFAPLLQGQVDVTAATDTGLADAKLNGIGDVHVMEVKDYLNIPSDLFVVTEDVFSQRRDELQRFLEVYEKSVQWMIDHPEEAAAIAKEHAIDGMDEARNLEIIKLRNKSAVDEWTEQNGLGALNIELLQQGADRFWKLGFIKKKLEVGNFVEKLLE